MRNKRRFNWGLLGVVLAGVLLLSGCVTMHSEIAIEADGSGTQTLIVAMSKEMMGLANQGDQGKGSSASKDPLADAQTELKAKTGDIPGVSFEPYKDAATGNEGFKAVIPFKSLDELTKMKLSDKESSDKITYTKSGNVITLKMTVNAGDMGAQSADTKATPQSAQDKAMQAQMMAAMGADVSYAIAVPGKIMDWAPKEGVTYDPAKNKLRWAGDFSKALNIMVKWDNIKKPEKINAPLATSIEAPAPPPAEDTTVVTVEATPTPEDTTSGIVEATPTPEDTTSVTIETTPGTTMLEAVQKYADAMMSQDEAALAALMVDGQAITHPLREKLPDMFAASDLSLVYVSTFGDSQMGAAEWHAQWTKDENTRNLSGMDVLTFDSEGKIIAVKSYVDPVEFAALQSATQ